MSSTIFVLMMLWGGTTINSPILLVQQEFSSLETCEAARKAMASADQKGYYNLVVSAQGCFKK